MCIRDSIRGAVEIRSHSGQLGAEVACRAARVGGRLIGKRFELLQLILQLLLCALGDGHGDIRLDLTGDAADVLADVYKRQAMSTSATTSAALRA